MLNFDTPQQGGNSRGRSQGGNRTGIPKLKTENVSTEPRRTEIIAVRDMKDQQACSVKVNYGGTLYLWNLKYSNPNLKALADLFGNDESAWAGRVFTLANKQDEFSGVTFPTVMGEYHEPTQSRKR